MTVIDKNTWPRKAHFDLFSTMNFPFYNVAFPVDATNLRRYAREHGLSFYYTMVWSMTHAFNRVDAFLYKIRGEEIIRHDYLVPSFTDLHPGSELFHIVTLGAGDDPAEFCRRAKAESAAQTALIADHGFPDDQLIFTTCLPWFPVSTLTNERNIDPDDSTPRIGWGRYEEREGRLSLTLSLEVNHRLIDGLHLGQFHAALQDILDAL